MPKKITYKEQDDVRCLQKVKDLLSQMPQYVTEYSYDLSNDVTPRTKMAYMYDIRKFLQWLCNSIPDLNGHMLKDVTVQYLDCLTLNDINEYKAFLEADPQNTNGPRGKARKMSSLNSLLDFLYRCQRIHANPMTLQRARHRKQPPAPIIRLQPDETARYLDNIEQCSFRVSPHQRAFLQQSGIRDFAIITLLLGTGIRVSECVGLDIEDLSFTELKMLVHRKGAKNQYVPMSDEVIQALQSYLTVREQITPAQGHEHALFLSSQKKRLCTRAVENLVKKYAELSGITKNISPHKLRKTFGTELYNQTGDIYLVARILGHNNVNTAKDHYILSDEDSLIQHRNSVKLR